MFRLKIATGNDAVMTPEDVADILSRAAHAITQHIDPGVPRDKTTALYGMNILDRNGNHVGEWVLDFTKD